MSGGFAAFFLAFLGPVTVVAVSAFRAHHIPVATTGGINFLQFGPAFFTVACGYLAGALQLHSSLCES